jgi:hypothetical protein
MRPSIKRIGAVLTVGMAFAGRPSDAADQTPSADEILRSCGIQAGLCVRIGTTDGRLKPR